MNNRTSSVLISTVLFFVSNLYAAPDDLDTSFGTAGSVTNSHLNSWYEALAIQNDGKIIAVGSGTFAVISRYTSTGILDTSFSGDGVDLLSVRFAKDVVIQDDGKILVLANWKQGSFSSVYDITVARYNTDGTLDTSFGIDGDGIIDFDLGVDFQENSGSTIDEPTSIALQADGKIIVGGQYTINGTDRRAFLVRINSDGSIDRTFGPIYAGASKGYRIDYACTPWTYISDIALALNGDIVVAGKCADTNSGSLNYNSYLDVYDSDGKNNPYYFTDKSDELLGAGDRFESVLVQPDGKIVAGGYNASKNVFIARFDYLNLSDMIFDVSFNTNGFHEVNASTNDRGLGIAYQADRKILLTGYGDAGTLVIRFDSDGSLDTGFGTNGVMPQLTGHYARAILMQPDGKLIFAGSTATDTSLSRLDGTPQNTQPSIFSFTDEVNTPVNTVVASDLITIQGLAVHGETVPLTIVNGEYTLNSGPTYSQKLIFVSQNDTVNVRHTSSPNSGTTANTILSVGGVLPSNSLIPVGVFRTDTFTSITGLVDTTPDSFNFTDLTDVPLSTTVTSNSIVVSNINADATISIMGGTFNKNGGGFTAVSTTVSNGDTISVQHTSSASHSTTTDTVLTIGGVSDTFSSSTGLVDTTPDSFNFTDLTDVSLSTTVTSNSIVVSNINADATISIMGGTFNKNGGGFTAVSTTVSNGDTISVQHTSSASHSTTTDTVLTIGGVSDTFSSSTLVASNSSVIAPSSGGSGSFDFMFLLGLLLLTFRFTSFNIHSIKITTR